MKILVCRAAFFFCAFLPTCLVAAWAVQRSQPIYQNAQQADWERFLSQRLGVTAKIAKLSYPSYWVARLDGLQLVDRESGRQLAECRSLEAARTKSAWIIEGSQPKVYLDNLRELAQLVGERLLREIGPDEVPCEFEIHEVTLQFGQQAQSITNVVVVCRPMENGAEAVAQFNIAGNESAAPCRLTVRRSRDSAGEVSTSWELIVETVSLPCSLVSNLLPGFRSLGDSAQFVGRAKGTVSDRDSTAEITGRFVNVDLDALVTAHSIHRLSGLAEVTVAPLRLVDGRVEEFQGTIDGRGGYVSESLLAAAKEHGHFGVDAAAPLAQDGLVAYRRLAAEFHATSGGVTIHGTADAMRDGVILQAATQTLLLEPSQQPLPAAALVRMLVPAVELQVPAAQETFSLLQAFPPAVAREPGTTPPRPRVQLRNQL